MTHLNGRVVVVTGAGGGFGRLICEMCAERGAMVVGGDIDGAAAAATASAIVASGGKAEAFTVDVTDAAQVDALVAFAVDRYGAVDVMVNNAGTMPLAFFADHARARAAWERCIDVNIKGVLNGITAAYDQMITQGRGHVVNISSIYGNFPNAGAGVYSATKAAVNVLSEALRIESQGTIKVTVVRPTGVPGTGLANSIVNGEAIVGILGQNSGRFFETAGQAMGDNPPAELSDPDSPQYWAISPEQLAENIVYAIDQPWGVSIAEITVRATGEMYVL